MFSAAIFIALTKQLSEHVLLRPPSKAHQAKILAYMTVCVTKHLEKLSE